MHVKQVCEREQSGSKCKIRTVRLTSCHTRWPCLTNGVSDRTANLQSTLRGGVRKSGVSAKWAGMVQASELTRHPC